MAAKSLLIVQHLNWEGPGQHLLAALLEGGITYEVGGGLAGAPARFGPLAGMIVLGGSPNVDEGGAVPLLRPPSRPASGKGWPRGKPIWAFAWDTSCWPMCWDAGSAPCPKSPWGSPPGSYPPRGWRTRFFRGCRLSSPVQVARPGSGAPPAGRVGLLARSAAAPVEAIGLESTPGGGPAV